MIAKTYTYSLLGIDALLVEQEQTKRGLEVAATGGPNVLML